MVERVEELNRVFHALADPTRRRMLERLSGGECTVTDLAEPFDMSLAAASKHIKVLERAQLVSRRWEGRAAYLSLDARALARADAWLEHYRGFWQQRLDALDGYLRKQKTKKERSQ